MNLTHIIAKRPNKTVYRDGSYAVKVFDQGYEKADVLNEALNQARVEDCGLFIPRIEEVTVIDGKWAIVTQFVEGETLAALAEKDAPNMPTFMEQFVDIQLQIHSHKVPKLTKLKDKMHGKISASGLEATIRYELHTRLEGMPKHAKLLHGDFDPSNIILTKDGAPCILDWAHATQGNASADAARTFLLFTLDNSAWNPEEYLATFCRKNDTALQYVQKWMPIVAASQLVKNHPAERELLQRWANVVEYE